MSARSSGRVGLGPNPHENAPMVFEKRKPVKIVDGRRKSFIGSCRFKLRNGLKLSPTRYIKRLSDKVVTVLRFVCTRRSCTKDCSSSRRAKPLVSPADSHRAEAIDECIDFINSSSSLQRSNSCSC